MPHDPADALGRLREALGAAGLDGALISRPQHIFWLTGVMPAGPAVLAMGDGVSGVIPAGQSGPHLPAEIDWSFYPDYDIHRPPDVGREWYGAAVTAFRRAMGPGGRVAAELDHLPLRLASLAPDAADLTPILAELRMVKQPDEVAAIRRSQAVVEAALAAVAAAVRPGASELELWVAAQAAAQAAAGGPLILEGCLGAGARTDNPECLPSTARLAAGDHVLVDLYPCVDGYYGDATRVYAAGPLGLRQREIYAVLTEALAAAEAALRPGVPANAVDRAARRVVEQAGYGERFPHHTGHGLGLFQQERPLLVPGDGTELQPGMVVAIEPGIYLPGWGGMRLEGLYLVTATGAERLDRGPAKSVTIQ